MSTSLTAFVAAGNLPSLDRDAMAKALMQTSAEESTGSGGEGVEYVSFSGKTGQITFGRDREALPEDEVFLMEPRSAFRGWVCWKNNKPVARHEWSIYQPQLAVAEHELEDKGPYERAQDGWQSLLGFGFMSLDGQTRFKFSTNSTSGKNTVTDLFNEIAQRVINGEPTFPLFLFTKERFQAQGEWNFKPKFVINEWLTEDEAAQELEGEARKEPEPKAAARPSRTRRT